MLPHVTTSSSDCHLYFYMRACKCQLFTDEGSRRLPKRMNYCFGVLASATNQLILQGTVSARTLVPFDPCSVSTTIQSG